MSIKKLARYAEGLADLDRLVHRWAVEDLFVMDSYGDVGYAEVGPDIHSTALCGIQLGPGETQHGTIFLTVPNDDAFNVDRCDVSCCAGT